VKDYCNENVTQIKISTIDWHSGVTGYLNHQVPCLAIGYENGKLQLMRHEKDKTPLIIDTQMKHLKVRWNHNGSLLAASGSQFVRANTGEEKEVCVVQVYNPTGEVKTSFRNVFPN
jgi:WD repeat-containing protein 35